MDLHPTVYKIVVGLAVWFVLAAWTFAGGGGTDLVLTVVSLFVLVSLGIPTLLALTDAAAMNATGSSAIGHHARSTSSPAR